MVRFKMNNLNRKIKLYADGPDLSEINKKIIFNLDGYTFNPSLFRKLGVKNYLDFCKKIIRKCSNKPISFEVFGDDEETMFRQALILSNLSKNIYVKIPITYTNGKSTKKLLSKLVKKRIPLNITAIFTLRQIKTILPIKTKTDIITMSIPMIKKINNFGISKENFSKQTVKQFFLDAKKSNYKL